jgi:hypothetical protein
MQRKQSYLNGSSSCFGLLAVHAGQLLGRTCNGVSVRRTVSPLPHVCQVRTNTGC